MSEPDAMVTLFKGHHSRFVSSPVLELVEKEHSRRGVPSSWRLTEYTAMKAYADGRMS